MFELTLRQLESATSSSVATDDNGGAGDEDPAMCVA
jgi:hypothetical protein